MSEQTTQPEPSAPAAGEDLEFGTIDLRLSGRDWLIVAAVVIAVLAFLPAIAERVEGFSVRGSPDYRVPYELSGDYWLFAESGQQAGAAGQALVIGDSVIWGEYVAGNQTLSHYLNELAGTDAFANLGIDGLYPIALEGLLRHYGGAIANRTVVVQFNPLWMASPVHDLAAGKTFRFNHPALIPQGYVFKGMELRHWRPWGVGANVPYWAPRFDSRIGPYSATLTERLANRIVRVLPYRSYVTHWRASRLGSLDLPSWTVGHPYEDPFAIQSRSAPTTGPDPAHYDSLTWQQRKLPRVEYPWVAPAESLQWRSFQAAIQVLLGRGNRVFVIVGPFNEHMLTDDSRARYAEVRSGIEKWLTAKGVPFRAPAVLPSECYADASHPLAQGYRLLAAQLFECEAFRRPMEDGRPRLSGPPSSRDPKRRASASQGDSK